MSKESFKLIAKNHPELAEKVLNFRGNVYDDEDSKIQLMIELKKTVM